MADTTKKRSLREMPKGRAYADAGKVNDRYKGLPQDELARRVQQDIAPYFGNAPPKLDPQTLRHHPWKQQGMPTTAGFNIPADTSDAELMENQRRFSYKDQDGRLTKLALEKGTINVVGNQHPRVWAHEVRHNIDEDGNGEVYNRLADAATARDNPDWESAVYMWRDKIRRDKKRKGDKSKTLPSEAQADLVGQLQRNHSVTPRNVYAADYERGARAPDTKTLPWQKPSTGYVEKRMQDAKWAQEAKDLQEFEKWKEGLPERNAKRKAGHNTGVRDLFKLGAR